MYRIRSMLVEQVAFCHLFEIFYLLNTSVTTFTTTLCPKKICPPFTFLNNCKK